MQGPVPARGAVRVRAVLRAAGGRLRPRPEPIATSASCAAASRADRRTSGATPTSCRWPAVRPGPRAGSPRASGLPAGCTPLIRADRLAERLGLREVWVKNDAANPTHSFKDRVVSVAVDAGARARLRDDRLRLDRQPRQLRRRPRRRAGAGVLRLHPRRPRGAEGARAPASTAPSWWR